MVLYGWFDYNPDAIGTCQRVGILVRLYHDGNHYLVYDRWDVIDGQSQPVFLAGFGGPDYTRNGQLTYSSIDRVTRFLMQNAEKVELWLTHRNHIDVKTHDPQ